MKKSIALVLATATVFTTAVSAIAADITPIGKSGTPSTTITGLEIGVDKNGNGLATILEPGQTYSLPVTAVYGSERKALTKEMMNGMKFQSTNSAGSKSVKSFDFVINPTTSNYDLKIALNKDYGVSKVLVKYNVKLIKTANSELVTALPVAFEVQNKSVNDNIINNLDEGEVIHIDQAYPIITTEQFETIAKVNNYRPATIASANWTFTANYSSETTKNFSTDNAANSDVLAKLPNNDFMFVNFRSNPTFKSFGTLTVDMTGYEDIIENGKVYTYRYADGKMYKINGVLNKDDNTVSFRTNKLGTFIMTDKEIQDGFVVLGSTVSNDGTTSEGDKTNPNTGANDAVSTAVALALVSLAAAGTFAAKKAAKK